MQSNTLFSGDNEKLIDQVIQEILLWIEGDISKSLLLVDIAARAGYSKWYFQRRFKKKDGIFSCSLHSYAEVDDFC